MKLSFFEHSIAVTEPGLSFPGELFLPVVEELEHGFVKVGDAFVMKVNGSEVVFEDTVRRFSPMGLPLVIVAEAFGELHGVAFVGLNAVTGFDGDE